MPRSLCTVLLLLVTCSLGVPAAQAASGGSSADAKCWCSSSKRCVGPRGGVYCYSNNGKNATTSRKKAQVEVPALSGSNTKKGPPKRAFSAGDLCHPPTTSGNKCFTSGLVFDPEAKDLAVFRVNHATIFANVAREDPTATARVFIGSHGILLN